jgi:large conductance mechanosensitive channel
VVTNIITPIIAAIFGQPDFSGLSFTLNGSEILYGAFLNSVIGFLIIVTAIFFLVVKPINAMMSRMRTEPTPDPLTGKCPFCLSEVQIGATRCPFCTQEITAVAA